MKSTLHTVIRIASPKFASVSLYNQAVFNLLHIFTIYISHGATVYHGPLLRRARKTETQCRIKRKGWIGYGHLSTWHTVRGLHSMQFEGYIAYSSRATWHTVRGLHDTQFEGYMTHSSNSRATLHTV